MRNEFNFRWENSVGIRSCPYLNTVVKQDHSRIKSRVQPMLGFKKFYNARQVIIGIDRPQALRGSVPSRLRLIPASKVQQNHVDLSVARFSDQYGMLCIAFGRQLGRIL